MSERSMSTVEQSNTGGLKELVIFYFQNQYKNPSINQTYKISSSMQQAEIQVWFTELYLFYSKIFMSQDKGKHFERQRNRLKPSDKKRLGRQDSVNTSQISSEFKNQSMEHDVSVSSSARTPRTHRSWTLPKKTQDALRKFITVKKQDLATIFKDKALRQQIKREEKRLTKMRTEDNATEQSDLELSLLALNNIISVSQEVIFDFSKDKQAKTPTKNVMRVNQEKQMTKQLNVIDEQIADNNISGAKKSIEGLLKRFGKDEFLQGKISHLTYMQSISQLYEKETNQVSELSKYLEKLSNIDNSSPETVSQSAMNLKGLKKELTMATTKQNKRPDKNEDLLKYLGQFDKVATILISYLEPKVEKKGIKMQMSVSKDLDPRVSSGLSEQSAKYCKDLLQKAEDKQALFKQIEVLKRNRKKANEAPYNLLIKLYDQVAFEKKQVTEYNIYLKSLGQIYFKKNLNAETMQAEVNRLEEKYPNNQVIGTLKLNLEYLINTVQEKERSGKELQTLQNQIKKLKTENERLSKSIGNQNSKIGQKAVDEHKTDKKKEMQEKRAKQIERSRMQKLEKDIEKALDNVFLNLAEKKWKLAKNAITVFLKRFEQANHPIVPSSIRSLNSINQIMTDLETYQTQGREIEKKQQNLVRSHQKQKQELENKLRNAEQFEATLKDLLEHYTEQKYPIKKFFDDLRRDRKKLVQDKYMLLNKLQEPLSLWRARKFSNQSDPKNISLTYSEFSFVSDKDKSHAQKAESSKKISDAEVKLNELAKDVDELLNLIKKIENGGEWWKFIPKNIKNNATLKPVYNVLDQYRKLQLSNQASETSTNLSKQQDKSMQSALTTISNSISKDKAVLNDDFWSKKLSIFQGKPNLDNLTTCLNELNAKHNSKLIEQTQHMKVQLDRVNSLVANLERSLSDRDMAESSSKKSFEMKSSRRSSRSREKRGDKSKEFIESYIQDERNYLNKIDEVEREKKHLSEQNQSLELRVKAVEQELQTTIAQKQQLEKLKSELENEKYKQFHEINNLKGQLEIAEGRVTETQTKYESDLSYFKELSEAVQNKIVEETTKSKQLEEQNSNLKDIFKSKGMESTHGELNLGFKVNLNSSEHVVDFFDTDAKRKRTPRPQPQPKKTEQAPRIEQNNESQIDVLRRQIQELQQKIRQLQSQNNKSLLVITDLTTQNNELKIKLENINSTQISNESYIKDIQNLKAENNKLLQQLQNFNIIKTQHIQMEVKRAVQAEVQKFNAFLEQFKIDQQTFFNNSIIPKKIEEALAHYKATQSPQRVQVDVNSSQFQELYRQRHEYQLQVATRKVEQYWKGVLAAKEEEWAKLRTDWEQLKRIQIEGIVKNQPNSDYLIEQWKQMFLPSIIQQERKNALEYFAENQLPNIINHEYNKWLSSEDNSKQQLLKAEWNRWNEGKEEQLSARLKEVQINYQAQIIEWQEKFFKEQQQTSQIEKSFKIQKSGWNQERQGWEQQRQGWQQERLSWQRQRQRWQKERQDWQQERLGWTRQKQALSALTVNPQSQQHEWEVKIVQLRNEWEKEKNEEISRILQIQINKCSEFHQGELTRILQLEKQQWDIWHLQQISIILSNEKQKWEQQKETQFEQRKNIFILKQLDKKAQVSSEGWKQKERLIRQQEEQQYNLRLNAQRAEWQRGKAHQIQQLLTQKRIEWKQEQTEQVNEIIRRERDVWQQQKQSEISQRLQHQDNDLKIRVQNQVKQRQLQWESQIMAIKQQQWRQVHSRQVTEIVNQKLAELERQFHEVRIPSILQSEYQGWVEENQCIMNTQRQNWLKQLPILLKLESNRVYIQPLLNEQATCYEQQIRTLKATVSSWEQKVRQIQGTRSSSNDTIKNFQIELTQLRSRLEETIRVKQSYQSELTRFRVEEQQRTIDSAKINDEATRNKALEHDINELRRIIESQKVQINNFQVVRREIEEHKREYQNLKENNRALETEISRIKGHYDSQLIELTSERNRLMTQISSIETHKVEANEKQSFSSLERQIAILLATIKTKDADIAFLKRSIDNHKDELKEARDQYSQALKNKHALDKRINELKTSKTEVDYQLKYLKEREDTLKRKVDNLEEENLSLRNRTHLETHVTESKSGVHTSFQHRFTEIESMLSLKSQECQSLSMEVDRLRYELQRSQASIHSSNLQIQGLRSHTRDNETHYNNLKLQHERVYDQLSRTKMMLNQASDRQEELNKKIQVHIRTYRNEQNDKLKVESELHRLTEQYNKLWRDFTEMEKINRRQVEKSTAFEREIRDIRGRLQVDNSQMQMLTKINSEVSELTMANRQLTMKVITLQNQQKIIANFKQIQRFFLLLQKHTDLLIDQLLKQGTISNLESYHRFLSESRPYLASGDMQTYFTKWQQLLKDLFQNCQSARSEEMREQAEELLRLKEEMNQILDKQIQVSQSDSGQLVEDYKAVLIDIKSLVREYVNSGQREYLTLLCQSLGIPQK